MKVRKIANLSTSKESNGHKYHFYCPGCGNSHWFSTPPWTWNNDANNPTVTPSILVRNEDSTVRCHLFVRNGKIEYLSDCEHGLKGTTVEMEDRE